MNAHTTKNILFSTLLTMLLLLTFTAISEDSLVEKDGFTFHIMEDGNLEVILYSGLDSEIFIPASVNNRKVTTIGPAVFGNDDHVEIIHIPEGVSHISEFAFSGSTLEYVFVPKSVKEIEPNAASYLSPRLIFVAEGYNEELSNYCSENNIEMMYYENYKATDRIVTSSQFDRLLIYANAYIGTDPETLEYIKSEDLLDNTIRLSLSVNDYILLDIVARTSTEDIIGMSASYQWDGDTKHLASYLAFINKLLFVSGILDNVADKAEYLNKIGLIDNLADVCNKSFIEDNLIVSYSIDQKTGIVFSIQMQSN